MINRVTLVGRLTADVELRKTNNGTSVSDFTIACNREGKKDEADFLRCRAWKQAGEFIGKYGKKGQVWGITGRLESDQYEKDGQKVYVQRVIAERVKSINNPKTDNSEPDEYDYGGLPY